MTPGDPQYDLIHGRSQAAVTLDNKLVLQRETFSSELSDRLFWSQFAVELEIEHIARDSFFRRRDRQKAVQL